ncbi:MAG: MobA/MobL family protein [Propionivibrio sp.]
MSEGLYHLTVKHGSRKDGRLGVDKHDYIMRLHRFEKRHDGELAWSMSGNMPAWATENPRKFWQAADLYERANGNIYHEAELGLPLALNQTQQQAATRELVEWICGSKHPFILGAHEKTRNPHVHLEWSGRQIDGIERSPDQFFKRYNPKDPTAGGAAKASTSGKDWLIEVRAKWAEICNRHLAAAGSDVRIDHRSHKDRGLDKVPGIHLGRKAHRLERAGKPTFRSAKNLERQYLNSSLLEVQSKIHHHKENSNEQRPGRSGKPHAKQQHRAGVGGDADAPKRAFTAWRDDRGSDRPGLRASRRAGPERMPPLRQTRAGDGRSEERNPVLQSALPGSRGNDHGLHSLSTRRGKRMNTPITLPPSAATAGLDCGENLERRQEFKKMIMTDFYHSAISQALADQLLYVDRRKDNTLLITLRDDAGSIAGQVHDKGDTLMALSPEINDAEILAMLELARAKQWSSVTPTGSPEFCKRVAELAAAGFGVDKPVPQNALTQSAPASSADSGVTAVTPEASVGAAEPEREPTAAEIRWADALLSARIRLADELKTAKARLAEIPQVDIAKLESDRAAKHGGDDYKTALSDYKAAVAAAKDSNIFTRSRAEDRKEAMRRRLMVAREKALAIPAAAASIKMAKEHNQERAQIKERLVPMRSGIGEIDAWIKDLRRGGDPEAKFAESWRLRKARDLQLWEQYALAPVFTADTQREQARQQAETESKEAAAAQARQEQAQREISWQQKADDLLSLLNQPGRSAEQQEALQQEHRYYTALAQGYDEAEARERAERAHPTDVARP